MRSAEDKVFVASEYSEVTGDFENEGDLRYPSPERQGSWPAVLKFSEFELDEERLELRRNGERVETEPLVFRLLAFFAQNPRKALSKEDLVSAIWDGRIISDAAISSQISAARRALGDSGKAQTMLKTLPRQGFLFDVDVDRPDPGGDVRRNSELQLPDRPSIAVLPFLNLSGDPEQTYFADGITDEIISALSRFRWAFIIARNSSFTYRDQKKDVREIARELGVRYILEGSVKRLGDRVRITAQLIDAESGGAIWTERYDRLLGDLFDLQDEVTACVASAIGPEIMSAEGARADRQRSEDLSVWDLVLKAQSRLYRGIQGDVEEAEALARHAIRKDPECAAAYRVAANCIYQGLISFWIDDRRTAAKEAFSLAEKAVELDPSDSEAHQILAMMYLAYRKIDEALRQLDIAIDLNPNSAHGLVRQATCLTYAGDPNEALDRIDQALRMSPRDPNTTFWRCAQSLALLMTGQYERAQKWARFSSLSKDYWAPSRWYWAASSAMLDDQPVNSLPSGRRTFQCLLSPHCRL